MFFSQFLWIYWFYYIDNIFIWVLTQVLLYLYNIYIGLFTDWVHVYVLFIIKTLFMTILFVGLQILLNKYIIGNSSKFHFIFYILIQLNLNIQSHIYIFILIILRWKMVFNTKYVVKKTKKNHNSKNCI